MFSFIGFFVFSIRTPRITWLKSVLDDLGTSNLTLTEAVSIWLTTGHCGGVVVPYTVSVQTRNDDSVFA